MSETKHIVLGVTGSIAAYKAVELVRMIRQKGWEVSVVMTRAATEFVGELTFRTLSRKPVAIDMFCPDADWCPDHISLADRADALVVAPCTANTIAKLAYGLADDLLSCTALATTAPVVVAPAMNERMFEHPATQANMGTLKSRGIHVMEVDRGELACGAEGRGRMASPEAIMLVLEKVLSESRS